MVTVIIRFHFPPIPDGDIPADVAATEAIFRAQRGVIRRQICLDYASRRGVSVHLWRDRESAEQFFAVARDLLAEHTGHEPVIEILDTQYVIDQEPVEALAA